MAHRRPLILDGGLIKELPLGDELIGTPSFPMPMDGEPGESWMIPGPTGPTGPQGPAGTSGTGSGSLVIIEFESGDNEPIVFPPGQPVTIDTDGTLAANSDGVVPSQKAVKTYVAAQIATVSSSSLTRGQVVALANGNFLM